MLRAAETLIGGDDIRGIGDEVGGGCEGGSDEGGIEGLDEGTGCSTDGGEGVRSVDGGGWYDGEQASMSMVLQISGSGVLGHVKAFVLANLHPLSPLEVHCELVSWHRVKLRLASSSGRVPLIRLP